MLEVRQPQLGPVSIRFSSSSFSPHTNHPNREGGIGMIGRHTQCLDSARASSMKFLRETVLAASVLRGGHGY